MSEVEENNKAVVRRFIEEFQAQGNLEVADELFAPDFVARDPLTGEEYTVEDYKLEVAEMRAASSDLHISIEEQIAEGETVVTRYFVSGTHDREAYEGVAPSGTYISIENVNIHRVVEGRIVEDRHVSDVSPFWQQRVDRERIERERVEQELLVTRRIQQASLPKEVPILECWQISPFYRPAREVGGDFYDFHLLSEGREHDHLEVGKVVEEVGYDVPIPHPLRFLLALLGPGDGIPGDRDAPVEVEVLEALPEHIGGGVVIGKLRARSS